MFVPRSRRKTFRRKTACLLIGLLLVLLTACFTISWVSPSVHAVDSSMLQIDLPAFVVQTVNQTDMIAFHGSEPYFSEEGRPLVPCLIRLIELPAGQRIQNVILKERSGEERTAGLRLPVIVLQEYPDPPVVMKPGWYPTETHQWQVTLNADGSSTLAIRIFPFYTKPDTLESIYYRHYVFEIESIQSAVDLYELNVDKPLYATGDPVKIDTIINNPTSKEDILIHVSVKRVDSGAVVDVLEPGFLKDLTGRASYQTVWTQTEPAGDYQLEVSLTDMTGSLLDSMTQYLIIRDAEEIRNTQQSANISASPTPAGGSPTPAISGQPPPPGNRPSLSSGALIGIIMGLVGIVALAVVLVRKHK